MVFSSHFPVVENTTESFMTIFCLTTKSTNTIQNNLLERIMPYRDAFKKVVDVDKDKMITIKLSTIKLTLT
jgi:hypothetical protein